MPQPLSLVAPYANVEIGNVGFGTIARRPDLAVLSMAAIAAWAHVESFMLRAYVELAGGSDADAAAVYLALEGAGPKTKVIAVLAERKLSAAHLALLRAILKVAKSGQKERDKLAHWIWGTSEELPEALLLADPRNLTHESGSILVYKKEDFASMHMRFERIASWGQTFGFILSGHPANRDGQLYEQLCREPEIAEILNRHAQQG